MPRVSVEVSADELPEAVIRRLGVSADQLVRVTAEIAGGGEQVHEGMALTEIARIMAARAGERGVTAEVLADLLELSDSERRNLLGLD